MSAPLKPMVKEPEASLVPLDTLARHHGATRLPLPTAMYLGANIARAVAEAHDRGEVLGTLDANRIRCSHAGDVVIVASGGSHMAPETKRGEPPDVLSDIYAVGAIVYRLLTGMTPLQAMTRQPVSKLHEVPAPSTLIPGVDPALDEVLLSALHHDPGERPISARVVCNTIDEIFKELELIASPSGVVRAVAATDSRRMRPRTESWTNEYTQPGAPKPQEAPTQTNSAISTAEADVPTELGSIIVSPSIYTKAVESPTIQTVPGSDLVQPTRDMVPPASVQNPTVLERPSRVGEGPTQSYAPPTSLIYGHPFFRREEGFIDADDVESLSGEATGDVDPLEDTVAQARKKARFAGEVLRDAKGRLRSKWRRANPATRAWGIVAFSGAVVAALLAVMVVGRSATGVEMVGDTEIAVSEPVRPVMKPVAAVVEAPVVSPPVVAQAKAPVTQAAPVVPARPAVKASPPAPTVSKAKKPVKLSKKALAAKKKAAKRAAARRHHR